MTPSLAGLMPPRGRMTLISARFGRLPAGATVEVRSWSSIADTMACGLCRHCTAQLDDRGGAVCVIARGPGHGGDGGGDDGGGPGPSGRRA